MHKHPFLPPRGTREIAVAKLIFSLLLVLLQPEGLLRQRGEMVLEERRKGEQRNFNVAMSVSRCLLKKSSYYHSFSLCSVCV